MHISDTPIHGMKIIQLKVHDDERGCFAETFQAERYREMLGIDEHFVQDNFSRSRKHVLRGMHLQLNRPQGKLIRVLQGEVYDVVVDCRPGSPSFGRHYGLRLSAQNYQQLWVPPGLAHGFVTLSEWADFEYKCTQLYSPSSEVCLNWQDPTAAIDWPVADPMVSDKDAQGLPWDEFMQRCSGYL